MKKLLYVILLILIFILLIPVDAYSVNAVSLEESLKEQFDKLDLTELNKYLENFSASNDISFYDILNNLFSNDGKYGSQNFFIYILDIISSEVNLVMPSLLTIVAICLICSILNGLRGNAINDEIASVIQLISFLCCVLILFSNVLELFANTKNIIENIAKLTEIMLPIMITLMIASGGNLSAGIYKPTVAFFSSSVIHIFINVVIPLIALYGFFKVMNSYSVNVKFNKMAEFFASIIKWAIGIITFFYGLIITSKGIVSSSFDVTSFKFTKYTIANSVPIVGGLIKDGFDVVVAGSSLIKSSLGIASVIFLLYIIISPLLHMIIFSASLKLISGIVEVCGNEKISDLLTTSSKLITYLIVCILVVGLMFFISILLMVISVNVY